MAFVICQPCIDTAKTSCEKVCVEVCPVKCVYAPEQTALPAAARQPLLYIHPYECVHCGACAPVCPAEAIFAEEDVPAKWEGYIETHIEAFEDEALSGGPTCPYGYACPYSRQRAQAPFN